MDDPAQRLDLLAQRVRARVVAGGDVGDDDLREMLGVLALENLLEAPGAPPAVVAVAQARQAARAAGDYARADALREEIEALGWVVHDSAGGFELAARA